jgi:hypothetical protein
MLTFVPRRRPRSCNIVELISPASWTESDPYDNKCQKYCKSPVGKQSFKSPWRKEWGHLLGLSELERPQVSRSWESRYIIRVLVRGPNVLNSLRKARFFISGTIIIEPATWAYTRPSTCRTFLDPFASTSTGLFRTPVPDTMHEASSW